MLERRIRTVVIIPALFAVAPVWAVGQEVDPSTATLLARSDAAGALAAVRTRIGEVLAELGAEPTSAQQDVLDRRLAPDALQAIMAERLQRLGDAETREAAATLMRDGAIPRVDSIASAQPPPETLDEYVARLESSPPSQARIQLMNQVVAAQAAGPARVLLAERIREAGYRIARSIGATVDRFTPLTQGDWVARAENAHSETVLSFLYRYQNVPDALLEARVRDWVTDAGAWFSEAYSVALAETVMAAADSVVAELGALPDDRLDLARDAPTLTETYRAAHHELTLQDVPKLGGGPGPLEDP